MECWDLSCICPPLHLTTPVQTRILTEVSRDPLPLTLTLTLSGEWRLFYIFSDYPELTNTLPGREGESEGFENGFFFPQPPSPPFPPSPNLFTEAPTPEFIGEKYNIYLLLGFSRLY